MNRSNKTRHSQWSRSLRTEVLLMRVAVIIVVMIGLLVSVSLGTRNEDPKSSTLKGIVGGFATRIRGWEPSAKEAINQEKSDIRSHAGFHFEWPTRLNPPRITLHKVKSEGRAERIVELLKLGRSKILLSASEKNENHFLMQEMLGQKTEVIARKNIFALMPGEKAQIEYESMLTVSRQWKFRIRAIAVTRDRLDSPLPFMSGFSKDAPSPGDVDPNGRHLDLEVPSPAEFTRRSEKAFIIEWPKEASGILIVEGLQPTAVANDNRAQMPRNLIIHINDIRGSISDLKQTQAAISKLSLSSTQHLHLTSVIPPVVDYLLAEKALLTGRHAVDLGTTLLNAQMKQFITPQLSLLKKTLNRGGSTRKISLLSCLDACSQPLSQSTNATEFTSVLTIRRKEEFSSPAVFIRNDEFVTDSGLLYVEVNPSTDKIRLNWESLADSQHSTLRWVFGGIRNSFSSSDLTLKNEERIKQIDSFAAKLIESFLVTSQAANIAIILHDNGTPLPLPSAGLTGPKLLRGEALLSLHALKLKGDDNTAKEPISTPIGLLSVVRFFENFSASQPVEKTLGEILASLQGENSLVSQLQNSTYLTLTPDGWLQDPRISQEHQTTRALHFAEPEKIHAVQEKSNDERRTSRLHGFHITLPSSNNKDEVIEIKLATSLEGLGCESQSENAQLKSITTEDAGPVESREMTIVGRRAAHTPWHLFCLFEGRITNSTHLRLSFKLNNQSVPRERLGLGEFALPIRGFLWRSPDTIELLGAQLLDATIAVAPPTTDEKTSAQVILWGERIPSGLKESRGVFSLAPNPQDVPTSGTGKGESKFPPERLSEK